MTARLGDLLSTFSVDEQRAGKQFERLCQWFLENDPIYRSKLAKVWLWDEWPGRSHADRGIDLVAETFDGDLWAIQAKHYAETTSVTKENVNTFLAESNNGQFAFRILLATTDLLARAARETAAEQTVPVAYLLRADLKRSEVNWPSSIRNLRPATPVKKKTLRPHQGEAIADVCQGFKTNDRGQLIMACGTGKTLTSLFAAEALGARRILVLEPSLALVKQTLNEWSVNSIEEFEWAVVCSDKTIGKNDDDYDAAQLGIPVTTVPEVIANFVGKGKLPRIVFSTYQSLPQIETAFKLRRLPKFDLVVADEAHHCVGDANGLFGTVLDAKKIPARKRLFQTATPKIFTTRIKGEFDVASMDDESKFGPVFHTLSFGEAIDRNLLCDYEVVVSVVDVAEYQDLIDVGRFVTIDGNLHTDARLLAGQAAVAKALKKLNLKRTIAFLNRIDRSSDFAESFQSACDLIPTSQRPKKVWTDFVSGKQSTAKRDICMDRLRSLDGANHGVVANAKCLGEGVDVPTLDAIAFIEPRRSETDIIQAVGRAIRLAPDKKIGTILVMVFVDGANPEQALESKVWKPIVDVLNALRSHDPDFGLKLDAIRRDLGRFGKGKVRSEVLPPIVFPESWTSDEAKTFTKALDVKIIQTATFVDHEGILAALKTKAGVA